MINEDDLKEVIKFLLYDWTENINIENFNTNLNVLQNRCSEIMDYKGIYLVDIPNEKYPVENYESYKETWNNLILCILTGRLVKFMSTYKPLSDQQLKDAIILENTFDFCKAMSIFLNFIEHPNFKNIYYASVVWVISRAFLDNNVQPIVTSKRYLLTEPINLLNDFSISSFEGLYQTNKEELQEDIKKKSSNLYSSKVSDKYKYYEVYSLARDFFKDVVIKSNLYRSVVNTFIKGYNENNGKGNTSESFMSAICGMKIDLVMDSCYWGLCGLDKIYLDIENICAGAEFIYAQCVAAIVATICHEAMHFGMRCWTTNEGFRYITPKKIIDNKTEYEGGYLCEELLWGDCSKKIWEKPEILLNAKRWERVGNPLYNHVELNDMKNVPYINFKLSGLCGPQIYGNYK
jgi:hypothetical protein